MIQSGNGAAQSTSSKHASLEFGSKLLKTIAYKSGPGNIFISPFSISTALAIVYGGALGQTSQELSKVTGFGAFNEVTGEYRNLLNSLQADKGDCELKIANSLWTDNKFISQINDQFVNSAVESFSASLYPVNFNNPATVDIVNNWVKNATQGKIDRVLNDTNNVVSLIINAIYFSGKWFKAFESHRTVPEKFYTLDNSDFECKMMKQEGLFRYFESASSQTIFLPYRQSSDTASNLVMAVCLPKSGSTLMDCFPFVENVFEIYSKCQPVKVNLGLPKFKTEFEIDLKSVLMDLGLVTAFESDQAQFDNIFPGYYIQKVLHKTLLEVDEAGTKAAAVTAVHASWGAPAAIEPKIEMKVNSPFLVAILDLDLKVPLFAGGIVKPEPF